MDASYRIDDSPPSPWVPVGQYPNHSHVGQIVKTVSAMALGILSAIGLLISISGAFSGSYFFLFPTIALFIPSMVLFKEGTVESTPPKPEIQILKKIVTPDNSITLYQYKVKFPRVDPEDYKRWLLDKDPSPQKQMLLEETLLKSRDWPEELTYFQIEQPHGTFLKLLDSKPEEIRPNIDHNWYDYLDEGHTYVDFDNGSHFCGGSHVEGMFFEFPELSMLHYATEKCGIHIRPCRGRFLGNDPTPLVFRNQDRVYKIRSSLYGSKLESANVEDIPKDIHTVTEKDEAMRVTITGIAARDWSGSRGSKYTRKDLLYHLHAAYLAFETERTFHDGAASVHTGPWGCGAFCNSEKTITTLQLLAARMARVQIDFHGVENISGSVTMLRGPDAGIVKTFKTPNEVIDAILEIQETDPTWRPSH